MILYRYAENKDVSDILSLDNENFLTFKAFYLEYKKSKSHCSRKREENVIGYVIFNQILDEAEIYK